MQAAMTGNPYRGEVAVQIGGQSCVLQFTWAALARLKEELGPDYLAQAAAACAHLDPGVLAKLASAGLIRRYPGLTPEAIAQEGPPIEVLAHALLAALNLALWGPEGQPDSAGGTWEKRTRPAWPPRRAISLGRLFEALRDWAWARRNSGA